MNRVTTWMPLIAVLLGAGWLAGKVAPPKDKPGTMQVQEFGQLPVVYQGRVKPYDTLARNALTIISDRQTFKDADGKSRPAIEWLLDVMSGSPRANEYKVFRIHNHEILDTLGLEPREGYRFSYAEILPKLDKIEQDADHAHSLKESERDVYDIKALDLSSRVSLFRILRESQRIPQFRETPNEFRADLQAAQARARTLGRFALPYVLPPHGKHTEWAPFLSGMLDGIMEQDPHPAVLPLAHLYQAWAANDTAAFNSAITQYKTVLAHEPPPEKPALGFEAAFNHFAPFYHCAIIYLVAFVIGCFAWLSSGQTLNRVGFWLIVFTFLVHTYALGARVYISGYPPITNLYGTAIFIGWGCVLLGIFLESIYRLGIGNLVASVVGFLTLLIAQFLAGDGDTLQMMQAVLDTKFWLATHVIIINFGYAAMFLSGGIGVLYILRGVLTRSMDKDTERVFGRMIYGVMSFALLLSFVGTVLGGLWADDSWGRFWGWDPKENGALMIVLWAALVLHARWGGMVKTRGVAVLSVFGNIVTSWSWFGVNQLGVGLHSYGFTNSVAFWLVTFVLSQLAIIGLGMLPRRVWRSADATMRTAKRPPSEAKPTPKPTRIPPHVDPAAGA